MQTEPAQSRRANGCACSSSSHCSASEQQLGFLPHAEYMLPVGAGSELCSRGSSSASLASFVRTYVCKCFFGSFPWRGIYIICGGSDENHAA